MLKEKIYFILGIGTDIGKTFLTEKLCQRFPNSKAIKPIATGFNIKDKNSDTHRLQIAMKKNNQNFSLEEITPYAYEKTNSPHLVAKINYQEVVDFCHKEIAMAKNKDHYLFIESAGGVMTPITFHKTFLDLAKDVNISVILITSNYLGAISHTLTAIDVLINRNIKIEKIFINTNLSASQNFFRNYDDIEYNEIANTLELFSNIAVSSIDSL
jgi:dethiobiotin synthetase